ncbi:MAG: hypothetical protein ACRDBO_18285 [Lachnospiraceae bacterium]
MLQTQKFRYHLGGPVKVCMACARDLKLCEEIEYGLCKNHLAYMMKPPEKIKRQFGRGREYQLLDHSDDLDDIIYRLEFNEETELCDNHNSYGKQPSEYLIFAHYIAKLFLDNIEKYLDLSDFEYITFADSGYVNMEIIFTEMGYLSEDKNVSRLFLLDSIHDQLLDSYEILEVQNKKVLLLDLYRGIGTRRCIDRLRLSGAGEVVTVYLTSFS